MPHGVPLSSTASPAAARSREWPAAWRRTLEDLRRLVAIPSVSGSDAAGLNASARAVAGLLSEVGAQASVLEDGPWHPAVIGRVDGPAGTPRVLLYAHHDVQPAGPDDQWTSPPFSPRESAGRLFGRGSADNKSGIAVHLAALRWFGARPPVNLTVLVEGEEEIASPNLEAMLSAHGDVLDADVVVIVDGACVAVGEPTLTTSTRGLLECDVTVRTLSAAVHSGLFGGPVPDALTVLIRLLATLHDREGRVAVRGMHRGDAPPPLLQTDAVRADAGLLPGVELGGSPSLEAALWQEPAITPIAVDAPPFADARNALEPVARARLSVRLAPEDDPPRAFAALAAHLHGAVERGAQLEVSLRGASGGWMAHTDGAATAAARHACTVEWGRPPAELGLGGSLPLLRALERRLPRAEIVVLGIQDPGSGVHGPDESIDLQDLERACRAEIDLLTRLAGRQG